MTGVQTCALPIYVDNPNAIEEVLEEYAAAGANLITTNTFGGTRGRLQMHGLEDRLFELNKAGAEIARKVADRHPGCYVMGDVGPSGELMEPMGTMTIDEAKALFSDQIKALVAGGVDAILIETMSDLQEVEAAVSAAKDRKSTRLNSSHIPLSRMPSSA